jgi:hypothetical protein
MSAEAFMSARGASAGARDERLESVLAQLGLQARPGRRPKAAKAADAASGAEPAGKKRRAGVKETPIFASLSECTARAEASDKHVTLLFEGARLFSLNEILSILDKRPQLVWRYKKMWRQLTRLAVARLGPEAPRFEACRLTLYRQGKKKIDRDSIDVMFKFIIDALKDEPKEGFVGLFPDDNPDVVQFMEPRQSVGPALVGLRVDRVDEPDTSDFDAKRLFEDFDATAPVHGMAPASTGSLAALRSKLADLGALAPVPTAGAALAAAAQAAVERAAEGYRPGSGGIEAPPQEPKTAKKAARARPKGQAPEPAPAGKPAKKSAKTKTAAEAAVANEPKPAAKRAPARKMAPKAAR